jgi:hypothetical protein
MERGLREAVFRDARRLVESLYNDRDIFPDNQPARGREVCHGRRGLRVETLFGPIRLERRYLHHPPSGTGRSPLDETLGLEGRYSPALARIVCRAASLAPSFERGAGELAEWAAIHVGARQFGRLAARLAPGLEDALATMDGPCESRGARQRSLPVLYVESDGTGTPMRKQALAGRRGKQRDGTAKTREAKLGCVFTQTGTDGQGRPVRDPGSTSYVGTYKGCREIGVLLRQEAVRRGLERAGQVVCLGDGAAWIWKNFELTFPGAVQILDYYHACEYLVEMAGAVHETDPQKAEALHTRWRRETKQSSPDSPLAEARRLLGAHPEWSEQKRALIQSKIDYLENHSRRTRYGEYRARGYFIGSGVVEAGCKTVVGARLKQSGMFWSEDGARNILSLRCLVLGPHFETAWKTRRRLLEEENLRKRRWLPDQTPRVA